MTAIPKNSVVLVTGANGFIASHVVDQLLEAGYRVRGTVRSVEKIQNLSALWEKKYGAGRFEQVSVADMSHDGAFDEAVKGVAGVVHVASNLTFDPDPHKVIPSVLAGINGVLKSAAAEPSVKRFVYTSSSTAATHPKPNHVFSIDTTTWNEEDIKTAWAPPPYEDGRRWAVYGASKTEGEMALWKFVKEQKPGFVANAVLPNANFGKILVPDQNASTGDWIRALYRGETEALAGVPPQWFVDVQDAARLHVAALINPKVNNERIFGFAEPYNVTELLRILRKIKPDHAWPADFTDPNEKDLMKLDNSRGAELLKYFGRPGWTSLEESLRNAVDSF